VENGNGKQGIGGHENIFMVSGSSADRNYIYTSAARLAVARIGNGKDADRLVCAGPSWG